MSLLTQCISGKDGITVSFAFWNVNPRPRHTSTLSERIRTRTMGSGMEKTGVVMFIVVTEWIWQGHNAEQEPVPPKPCTAKIKTENEERSEIWMEPACQMKIYQQSTVRKPTPTNTTAISYSFLSLGSFSSTAIQFFQCFGCEPIQVEIVCLRICL